MASFSPRFSPMIFFLRVYLKSQLFWQSQDIGSLEFFIIYWLDPAYASGNAWTNWPKASEICYKKALSSMFTTWLVQCLKQLNFNHCPFTWLDLILVALYSRSIKLNLFLVFLNYIYKYVLKKRRFSVTLYN